MSDVLWVGVLQVVVAAGGVVAATLVSVRVARGEREARELGAEREASRLAEDRRVSVAAELLGAVSMLSQAAFEVDAGEEARLRVVSGRHLAQSAVYLDASEDAFINWVAVELQDIGEGLNDRDFVTRVPVLGQQIQWRSGHLIDFIMVWLRRVHPAEFFEHLPHQPLESTVPSKLPGV